MAIIGELGIPWAQSFSETQRTPSWLAHLSQSSLGDGINPEMPLPE